MRPKQKPANQEGDRNFDCKHYDSCLDHAVKHRWLHWHCGQCSLKAVKKEHDAVQTVPEHEICYELPASISRELHHRYS